VPRRLRGSGAAETRHEQIWRQQRNPPRRLRGSGAAETREY
jgi:hypothetical protein